MPQTKKVGPAGRFGPRYGTKMRKLVSGVERKLRKLYVCPNCGAKKVKRISTSIWQCGRCGTKLAGAAYSLAVPVGEKPIEGK